MDQSVWVKALHSNGPSMMKVVVGNSSHENSDTDSQCMWELIQKKSPRLFRKCVPNPAEEKKLVNDIGLQPVPPEIYRKNLTVTQRRSLFYQTLFRKDILYLRVVNIRNPYDYKLQVVAKHGNCMRLEDLQIIMYLPKIPEETKFFKGGLWEFEYIRGALCSCSIIERKLFVTLDPLIFEGAEAPKLGKVGVNDLPFSLWCPEIGMSIYGYLIKSRVFYKTHLESMLRNVLGIEGNQHISLFQEWDRKKYPFEETPANFPKLFTCAKSSALLRRSIRLYIVGDMQKAFKYANRALSLDPDAVYTRVCRGVLNVLRGNLTAAFVDTQDSLKLDHKSELAKKQMSALLIVAAEKYFQRRDFTKLYKTLLVAIGLNPGHFKGPAVLETLKVVRYIYRMTRDPQFSFPFAPTHQKILSRFFKNEGSLRQKFVLPPNYHDDHATLASRSLQARQMKLYQRSEERNAETEYRHHHQNNNYHHKPSKSGSRRQRSRSRSTDRNRRHRPGSFTSELNLLRESLNRISNANKNINNTDSTPNQLQGNRLSYADLVASANSTSIQQCDSASRIRNVSREGEQQQRVHGTRMGKTNKEMNSEGYVPNQQCNSDIWMNKFKQTEGRRRFRRQQRNTNLVVCVDSTSELKQESRTQKSFENQDVSEDNTFDQQPSLGKRVKNANNIAPLRSTRNLLGGSRTRRSNLNQSADSTLNCTVSVSTTQSTSGMLKSKSSQSASVKLVSNQQDGSGTNINNANLVVAGHSESNQHCKARDPQSSQNQSVDSMLNQQLGCGTSKLNQKHGSESCMNNTNSAVDSLSNQQHRSRMPKSCNNPLEPVYFKDINAQKSAILMNTLNQHISVDSGTNETGTSQTHNSKNRGNLNKVVSVDSIPNQQSGSQISNINENQDVFVHQLETRIPESSMHNDQIAPLYCLNSKTQSESGMRRSSLNMGTTFSSASNHPDGSGTLKSSEKQSISVECTPSQQYIISNNNRDLFSNNSDSMKEHEIIGKRYFKQSDSLDSMLNQQSQPGMLKNNWHKDITVDSTDGSGSSKNSAHECSVDLDIIKEHQQSGTIIRNLNQFNSVCSLPNQQHGFGMLTNNANQDISIRSTPVQQPGSETWMSNLNQGTTMDPLPKRQGGSKTLTNRFVPVYCTDIHKQINSETVLNISDKSSTDSAPKKSRSSETSKTSGKRVSIDYTRDQQRRSKVRKGNFNQGISADMSNPQRESKRPKSTESRVVSITAPDQQHDSAKRISEPGSQRSNWTRQVSISSGPYQEQGCRKQVNSANSDDISVNEPCGSGMGIDDENEDVICVSYTTNPQKESETQVRDEDEDVICIDYNPGQKPSSESRINKPQIRYGSVCCTCDQNKRHRSWCHKCDVNKRHRSGSPLYYRDRRRSKSPSYYREKRHRSESHSSDHRYKRRGSRSHSSGRDKRR